MPIPIKRFAALSTVILLFMTTLTSIQQVQFSDAGTASCVNYQREVNTIMISCDASFQDIVQSINQPSILDQEAEQNGQYILNANLVVSDGVTFQMTSSNGSSGLRYLKLAGTNGIIVYGKILIDGVKITSWDTSQDNIIQQDTTGAISRGYIQFAASEGSQISNSEFEYLGYDQPGRRGFDLYGGLGPTHDMVIRGSTFHDMWMGFYSTGAYNIVVDKSEYHHNLKYALDPHTGTHDMNITNNYLQYNRYGAICSKDCYNILIEGNAVDHNTEGGIVFSRNMTNSIARNNHIYNATTGISLSESRNNQIYNNTIESTTDEGILLISPEVADDGFTENNLVYNNTIANSDDGIRATKSHDNVLENNTFSNISSSEYRLSENSKIEIRGQDFDDGLIISTEGSSTNNFVRIVDSGIIQVSEGPNGQRQQQQQEVKGNEATPFNTDIHPYTRTMGAGDSITINS